MSLRPPSSTRTDTLFPDTTLFRTVEAAGSDGGIGGVRATGLLERGDGNAAHQQRGNGNGDGVLVHEPLLMADVPLLCARQFQHPLPEWSFPATARNRRHDESTPYIRPVVAWCAPTSSSPAKRESIMPNPLLAPLMRWFGRLSYPKLFLLTAALFVGRSEEHTSE